MILAHKIALDATPEQASYFARAAGTARFAWNWAVAEWQRQYAEWREYRCGPRPSEASLRRQLNALKADAFPWMAEVTKNAAAGDQEPWHRLQELLRRPCKISEVQEKGSVQR